MSAVALLGRARADEAYITDQNGNDVSVLDLAAKKVVATIKVGGKPAGIAMAHDGRHAYVSSTNGKYVSDIDTATRAVVGKLDLPDEAVGIAIGKTDRFVYAVGFFKGTLFKIDARTGDGKTMKVVATAEIGGTPSGIAMTPDGKTLVITKRDADQMALVDADTLRVEGTVGVGHRPYGIIVDAEGKRAYMADVYGDDVSVVDLEARKLAGTVKTGKRPYVVALAAGKGFVTDQYEGKVAVFDLATLQPITRVAVGDYPDGIEASFDRKSIYVVNWESNTVSRIDTASLKVTATMDVGDSPRSFGTFLRRTP